MHFFRFFAIIFFYENSRQKISKGSVPANGIPQRALGLRTRAGILQRGKAGRLKEIKKAHPSTEGLRVMGNGEIKRAVTVKANYVTTSAKEKIEAAGGKVELV